MLTGDFSLQVGRNRGFFSWHGLGFPSLLNFPNKNTSWIQHPEDVIHDPVDLKCCGGCAPLFFLGGGWTFGPLRPTQFEIRERQEMPKTVGWSVCAILLEKGAGRSGEEESENHGTFSNIRRSQKGSSFFNPSSLIFMFWSFCFHSFMFICFPIHVHRFLVFFQTLQRSILAVSFPTL